MQEQTQRQSLTITDYDLTALLAFAKDGKCSQQVVDAVKKAAAIQARSNDAERALGEIDRQTSEIAADQGRIRNNMNSVDRNSDLYRRYVTKLNEQESSLERLAADRAKAEQARLSAEKELRDYLRDLDVE